MCVFLLIICVLWRSAGRHSHSQVAGQGGACLRSSTWLGRVSWNTHLVLRECTTIRNGVKSVAYLCAWYVSKRHPVHRSPQLHPRDPRPPSTNICGSMFSRDEGTSNCLFRKRSACAAKPASNAAASINAIIHLESASKSASSSSGSDDWRRSSGGSATPHRASPPFQSPPSVQVNGHPPSVSKWTRPPTHVVLHRSPTSPRHGKAPSTGGLSHLQGTRSPPSSTQPIHCFGSESGETTDAHSPLIVAREHRHVYAWSFSCE